MHSLARPVFVISTSELVAVNAIAVQYFRRVDPSSLLAALQIAELLLVISGSFNSVLRTDRSTELLVMCPVIRFCMLLYVAQSVHHLLSAGMRF